MENTLNTSGQGPNAQVPEQIAKEFNWGAFLLSWIWGLGNSSFITLVIIPAALLSFIPFAGFLIQLGLAVWFGMKGNTWAWQNKQFESVEKFNEYQKKWAVAGVIVLGVSIVLAVLFMALAFLGLAAQAVK